jgi:hypothetical protein
MPEFYRPPVQTRSLTGRHSSADEPGFPVTTFASETNNGAALTVLVFNFRQARLKHW